MLGKSLEVVCDASSLVVAIISQSYNNEMYKSLRLECMSAHLYTKTLYVCIQKINPCTKRQNTKWETLKVVLILFQEEKK